MPADSVSGTTTYSGTAIQMDAGDHALTASYGNSARAIAYRNAQAALIKQGDTAGAIYMDIQDIQGLFGSKYDDAIYQMLQSSG